MSITFRTYEAACEHARYEHGIDIEHERLARRFDDNTVRGHAEILEAAHLLHGAGFITSVGEMLEFFEKPWHYGEDVWAAALTEAGIDPDECDECD